MSRKKSRQHRRVGVSACRHFGKSAFRRVGVSECRSVGVSACRRVGVNTFTVVQPRRAQLTVRRKIFRPAEKNNPVLLLLFFSDKITVLRQIEKGDSVGYGRSFVAERSSQIAILPIGYGDGFPRSLSNGNGRVLIGQYIVPVIGRICMDQLAIDITDAEGIAVGDIATLIDTDGCTDLSADVVAKNSNSISNELLCRMGERLPVIIKRQ